ncbi:MULTISPECIES: fumarylacetoacetate hydrolase family protein [unclassified Dietzia]|uniref:fumarylacetoacetate hydrolase family protein n=1 Tax=unclassified Dietzia TaxID=2617939 RepID=UPI0015F89C81|nr:MULTISPECIES: fumarylacetoacetate hydrolase family protein [unclassified Dietzia]MBB1024182.1 fumarylacetoacetate hydrolase family protein [Dietzia sp. DQ12-76]MBB1026329.1 fumarylacetoacetate hydrolase family protein [Dietzia sp. DQ11-38-2]
MKIARMELDGGTRAAVVDDDRVQPLAADITVSRLLEASPPGRLELVDHHPDGPTLPLSDVHLLAPVEPPTLRDFLTFEEHLEGSLTVLGATEPLPVWYEMPLFYFSNTNAVIGPDAEVAVPPGCELLDFELELAVVIGRAGRDLTPDQAHEHIAGFTLFNDWSARDLMKPVTPFGMGPVKGKDFANSIGPWIVTPDELEPFRRDGRLALDLHVELNGVPLPAGGDNSANMAWSFEEMIAFASRGAELRPGDVLGSGTCGAGCLLEYWAHLSTEAAPPLRPGDVVTLVAEGIGALSNTVVAGAEAQQLPRARVGQPRRQRSWTPIRSN